MTWLVFALGVALALAGVVSVVSGAPIIQIERGWAEVIAGSVAVSGGVVAFALGVVLLRLQALLQVAQRSDRSLPTAAPAVLPEPALAVAQDDHDLRPTRAPEETLFVGSAESLVVVPNAVEEPVEVASKPAEPRVSRWMVKKNRTEPAAEDEPLSAIVPHPPELEEGEAHALQSVAPDGPVHGDESVQPGETGPLAPSTLTPEPEEEETSSSRRLLTPPPSSPRIEPQAPVRPTLFFDWRSKPLLRSRQPAGPTPDAPPPMFETPPMADEDAPPVEVIAVEPDQSHAPPIDVQLAAEDTPAPTEPAVIGRYQAGASSYTMYSDGAIDVETEGGERHRFASMDELKAFIARQEQAVT